MTVTLNLKPELEADLLARARASGMGLEEYLLSLVEGATAVHPHVSQMERTNAVRRMMEFSNKYRLSLGQPVTRELLHEGHRI